MPPFASKPAPTFDLCTTQIKCGSGLAREGVRKIEAEFKAVAKTAYAHRRSAIPSGTCGRFAPVPE
ncbi:hypothetical protein CUN63_16690 [Pseudomonas sp. ACM7]|nr:hypothetical protein CUN63_16690 [Pseudomonas sp. ACM7]